MFPELNTLQTLAIWTVPVLLAITLHEVSHGWAARYFGDHTAERLGRLSLNPLRHVDPVGTVIVPGLLLMLGGFLFGWAKPVPVAMQNLRKPRQHMAWVALAGPMSNFVMGLAWGLLLKLSFSIGGGEGPIVFLRYMAVAGIVINLILMVLNLIPVPPLDGGRVIAGLVPEPVARQLDRLEPWGLLILVGLLASGMLGHLMGPPLALVERALSTLLGLPSLGLF